MSSTMAILVTITPVTERPRLCCLDAAPAPPSSRTASCVLDINEEIHSLRPATSSPVSPSSLLIPRSRYAPVRSHSTSNLQSMQATRPIRSHSSSAMPTNPISQETAIHTPNLIVEVASAQSPKPSTRSQLPMGNYTTCTSYHAPFPGNDALLAVHTSEDSRPSSSSSSARSKGRQRAGRDRSESGGSTMSATSPHEDEEVNDKFTSWFKRLWR